MELTTTIESCGAGDAAPDDGAGSCAARDMEGIRSNGDAPGATRARGGSARTVGAGSVATALPRGPAEAGSEIVSPIVTISPSACATNLTAR